MQVMKLTRITDRKYAIIVSFTVILLALILVTGGQLLPVEEPLGLALDSVDAIVCALLLFKVEELRRTGKRIYLIIFFPVAMLLIGSSIDLAGQVFQIPEALELIEEILHNVGFILFVFACVSWVNYQREQSEELRHLAELDSLTGISNRRSFLERCQIYLKSEYVDESSVSLLLLDIDHFKQINDSFGHQVGDQILIDVARTVKEVLRKDDYFARIGGEEFIILLKDVEETTAKKVAEKIRLAVESISMLHNGSTISCTISIGATVCDRKQADFDDLFNQADKALYSAKAKGRNCVVQYGV